MLSRFLWLLLMLALPVGHHQAEEWQRYVSCDQYDSAVLLNICYKLFGFVFDLDCRKVHLAWGSSGTISLYPGVLAKKQGYMKLSPAVSLKSAYPIFAKQYSENYAHYKLFYLNSIYSRVFPDTFIEYDISVENNRDIVERLFLKQKVSKPDENHKFTSRPRSMEADNRSIACCNAGMDPFFDGNVLFISTDFPLGKGKGKAVFRFIFCKLPDQPGNVRLVRLDANKVIPEDCVPIDFQHYRRGFLVQKVFTFFKQQHPGGEKLPEVLQFNSNMGGNFYIEPNLTPIQMQFYSFKDFFKLNARPKVVLYTKAKRKTKQTSTKADNAIPIKVIVAVIAFVSIFWFLGIVFLCYDRSTSDAKRKANNKANVENKKKAKEAQKKLKTNTSKASLLHSMHQKLSPKKSSKHELSVTNRSTRTIESTAESLDEE